MDSFLLFSCYVVIDHYEWLAIAIQVGWVGMSCNPLQPRGVPPVRWEAVDTATRFWRYMPAVGSKWWWGVSLADLVMSTPEPKGGTMYSGALRCTCREGRLFWVVLFGLLPTLTGWCGMAWLRDCLVVHPPA